MFQCPIGCPSDCCHFSREEDMPVVTEDEAATLRREAEKRGIALELKPHGRVNGRTLYRWVIWGWCPFYRGKCQIHDRKPLACRMYPLVLNATTGEVYLSERCLWVKVNGPRPLDHFPAEREALRRLVIKLRL